MSQIGGPSSCTWRMLIFLTGDLEDKFMLDIKDVLSKPKGSYPDSFLSMSQFLADIAPTCGNVCRFLIILTFI